MTFGERILLMRRRRGMTQRELGQAAKLNSNTIARLERGDLKDIAGQAVARLARALGVSADYLLGLTDAPAVRPKARRKRAAPGQDEGELTAVGDWEKVEVRHG
jgi:transcriptional regulator with XRE-family HTH domain